MFEFQHTNSNEKNISFIRARDPSILAWNRPALNPEIRVALCEELSSQSMVSSQNSIKNTSDPEPEHIQVYLRIKPSNSQDLYEIKNNKVLICRVPDGSQAFRNLKEGDRLYKKYSFSKIFGPGTRQDELFNDCVKEKVLGFINGQNSTLFTYGASGSGKTFTILGDDNNPGIIPRALEYIFRTLPSVEDLPQVKPLSAGNVKLIDREESKQEKNLRHDLVNATHNTIDKSIHAKTYRAMQERLSKEPSGSLIEDSSSISLSVWVSFAEVYNEYVYDLLQPEPPRGRLRPKLPLGLDGKGRTYIKNLSNVCVSSGLEAYEILQYGMHNLNYATTALNQHSSRSHCIFTIKLVQATLSSSQEVLVSHFNFCDLAGSERIKNSCSVGDRLKESNNINVSLHVLGRCIKSIRESQKSNDSRLIPFRESKLTRLFQPALSGQETIAMIVNMNPKKDMFDESQHVLNFSAIAKDVTVEIAPEPKKITLKNRISQCMDKLPMGHNNDEGETDMLREQVSYLLQTVQNERMAYEEKEMNVRRELTTEFHKIVAEIVARWENRVDNIKRSTKEMYEKRIEELKSYYENLLAKHTIKPEVIDFIDLTSTEANQNMAEVEMLKFELKSKDKELTKLKEDYNKMATQFSETKRSEMKMKKILEDARNLFLELQKEKEQLEIDYEEQTCQNYNLQKEVEELTEQLSAQAVQQIEKAEYVEQLEEQLNKTLGDLDDNEENLNNTYFGLSTLYQNGHDHERSHLSD